MKRRELLRHFNSHGCGLLREGGNHSWWLNGGMHHAVQNHKHLQTLQYVFS
jgi:mRNA interferase HicA